jgi:hypothetical protein
MVQVAKLSADLTANTTNFDTNIKRSSGIFSAFKRGLGKDLRDVDKSFLSFSPMKTLGTMSAAAVAAGVGLGVLAKKAVDSASAVNDTAEALQLGTDDLQKFQYAAQLSGIDTDKFAAIVTKINGKIADGSYQYKNAAEALYSIADGVQNAKTEQQKLAIVNDAFGAKLGGKTIPLLKNGSAGLKALGDEAERTGNVLSSKTIKAAEEFGDTMDIIASTIQKNFQQGFLDAFVDQSGKLREVYTDPEFTRGIKEAGTAIGGLTEELLKAVAAFGRFIVYYKELANSGPLTRLGDNVRGLFDTPEEQDAAWRKNNVKNYGMQFGPPAPSPNAKKFLMSGDSDKKRAETLKSIFDGLSKENQALTIQNDLYGQQSFVIQRATKEAEIKNKLAAEGIKLNDAQQKQLDLYLDTMEEQKSLQEHLAQYQNKMQELSDSVSSSFEDAILNGGKLGDVFESLLKDIQRMALKSAVLEPLFGNGTGGSGGIFGGLIGNLGNLIFGGVPSHATGIDRVPRDMLARVHKGEEIVSARDVEAASRGGYAETKVSIYNNDKGNQVTAAPGADGESLDIVIDRVVAKNMNKRGSSSNSALKTYSSRTIIRR